MKMNDTYIVNEYRNLLAIADKQPCNRRCSRIQREMACKGFQPLENELAPKKALAIRLFDMKFLQQIISGSPGAAFGQRQQSRRLHFERLCQDHQFGIRDAPKLRFNFRERAATQIPTEDRTARGEHCLRHFLLITQLSDLRANNVLRFSHAPKMELDTTLAEELNCSVFGATCATAMAQRNIGKAAGKMKHFENPPTDIYPIVTSTPFARLKNKQH